MSEKPREFQIYKTLGDDDMIWSAVEDAGDYENSIHVIEYAAFEKLKAENERLKVELAKWKNIEQLAECTYKEIYANVYKLKPGKYAPNARDLPCCNCGDPDNAKIHDEICDILEERGFNETDVCTASVGIWAALAWYEKIKAKLAEVEAERERLEDLLGAIHDTTLEADTKSRIANNLDATPNGWRFRKSQLTREREASEILRKALEFVIVNSGTSTDYNLVARKAIAKADEIRGGG